MYKAQNIIPAAQDLAAEWVKHAAEGTSSQADAVVGWALSRINHADVPSVVHGVMLTLTGNRKAAKRAQRTAARAVKRTTQTLSRRTSQRSSPRAGWLVALAVAGVGAGIPEVVADRVVEEVGVLADDADRGPQRLLREVAHVDAVDADGAARDVVEAGNELRQGGLAGPRRTPTSICRKWTTR